MKEVNMSIVGEVIENLMGDSYHSLYLRDPRYLVYTDKSRKTSLDTFVFGKSIPSVTPLHYFKTNCITIPYFLYKALIA